MIPSRLNPLRERFVVVVRRLFLIACLYHFALLAAVALLPSRSALRRSIPRIAEKYLEATGNHNRWNMFDARPKFHSYRVELMASTANGERSFGPLLPGLRPYDSSRRAYKLFLNLSRKGNRAYRRSYLRSALEEIEATTDVSVRRIWLRYHLGYTNSLSRVRKTGEVESQKVVDLGF